MNDPIELFRHEQIGHTSPVGNIKFDKPEAGMGQQAVQAVLFEGNVVVVVQVVQPDHFIAARQQPQRSGHADEAGGPR